MKIRVGFGFDVHQLVEGRELWLGGILWNTQKDCWGIRMLMYYCMLFAMLCWGRRICVILAIISPIRQENLRI